MRHPYLRVWKVLVAIAEDEESEDPTAPIEYVFTNARAANAFARRIERDSAWVLGPWEALIFRTAKLAVSEHARVR